jgi:hypothetical protein
VRILALLRCSVVVVFFVLFELFDFGSDVSARAPVLEVQTKISG